MIKHALSFQLLNLLFFNNTFMSSPSDGFKHREDKSAFLNNSLMSSSSDGVKRREDGGST